MLPSREASFFSLGVGWFLCKHPEFAVAKRLVSDGYVFLSYHNLSYHNRVST